MFSRLSSAFVPTTCTCAEAAIAATAAAAPASASTSALLRAVSSSRTRLTSAHLPRRTLASRSVHSRTQRFSSLPEAHATPRPLVRSGFGFTLCVLALGIAVGSAFVAYTQPADLKARNVILLAQETPAEAQASRASSAEETAPGLPDHSVMSTEIPPGRPGNLTPEQETKLRELWAQLAKLTGVGLESSAAETSSITTNGTDTTATTATSATPDADGKKKSKRERLNVFKRKHGDKEKGKDGAADAESAPAGAAAGIDISTLSLEDDKHGAVKAFKAALADFSPEELHATIWSMVKHDNPDALLLRFLRARKWDVQAALIMLISTLHWRATEMHVDDDIVRVGELGAIEQVKKDGDATQKKESEDFLAQLRMGKSFLHGVDKEGRPMCFVRVRLHRQGEQTESSLERYTVYTIETARLMLRPPVDTATIVFDMTNFSMANMDYTPVKFMIKCFEANYPESLGAVLVHKAPWVFQGIWTIIRGWLDPVVAGKVHFTRNVDELAKFVPRSQIPTELEGDEKWEYSYVEPAADENATMQDTATRDELLSAREDLVRRYEDATTAWIKGGAEDEAAVKKERQDIADQLRDNYWKLDPYIRAKTLYDRIGVLGKGDALNFYPKKEEVKPTVETSADDLD